MATPKPMPTTTCPGKTTLMDYLTAPARPENSLGRMDVNPGKPPSSDGNGK